MMTLDATVRARVDGQLKKEVEEALRRNFISKRKRTFFKRKL